MNWSKLQKEDGVQFIEYIVVLAALIVVFLAARDYLSTATEQRYDMATNSVNSIVPCDTGMLSGDDCL